MLENNNDIFNHCKNIQILFIEVFKLKMNFPRPIMESMLNRRISTYNLRNFQEFVTDRKKTIWYGLKTLSYRYLQLWSLLPEVLKETNSLSQLKRNSRQWICNDCPRRLRKKYIQNIGFL